MKDWYSDNGLKMNPNKTQCILFATPDFNKRAETFQLTIDSMVKHMEEKVKNLGETFDSRLSFDCHIKSLCSRLKETLSYLNKVKNTIDRSKVKDPLNKCSYFLSFKLLLFNMGQIVKNSSIKNKNVYILPQKWQATGNI